MRKDRESEQDVFSGMSASDLKQIAVEMIEHARNTTNHSVERLGALQISQEALEKAQLTVQDIGLKIEDVIELTKDCWAGYHPEVDGVGEAARKIISSYPRK